MQKSINISDRISENLILVAEDDDINFKLLHFVLSRMNYKVIRATNGKQAVSMFATNPNVDLIITDLSMPEMDGIEATKQIRAINKEIPIIIQTGYSEFNVKDRAMEAGCSSFITKPINRNDLLLQIREQLNENSQKTKQYRYCS